MLIAIMGDTYDKVRDQQDETILTERVNMLADYLSGGDSERVIDDVCIYILTPTNAESGDSNWSGRLTELKESYVKGMTQL